MTPDKLDQYRNQIEEALRQSGYDVDSWKAAAEKDRLENPRPTPATRIIEGYTLGVKMVRPGYEEYRPHGRYEGILVPRCLARSATRGDQCGAIAVNGAYHCTRHGGRRPGQHRKGADHHWFQGKNESRSQRRHRKNCRDELKEIEAIALQHGVLGVTVDMRGPRPGTSWEKYLKGREKKLRAKQRANQPHTAGFQAQ